MSRSYQKNRPVQEGFFQQRLREGVLILVMALALYLLLSLGTYHLSDPSWSHASLAHKTLNAGGRVGSYLADILLYLFGYLAYLFPILMSYAAWLYFRKPQEEGDDNSYYFAALRGAGFLFIFATGCGLASLHISASHYLPFTAGGVLGNWVGFSMANVFNGIGASLILFALFLVGITLFTGVSWLKVADWLGQWVFNFGKDSLAKLIAWRERKMSVSKRREPVVEKEEEKPAKARSIPIHRTESKVKIEPKLSALKVDEEDEEEDFILSKPQPMTAPTIARPPKVAASVRAEQERQTALFEPPLAGTLPPISLLDPPDKTLTKGYTNQQLEEMSRQVELRLQDFGIEVKVVAVHPGPVVTRFELQLAAGTKVSRITTLAKDLARSLSVISVRVVEVIPGKSVIGLELPNIDREVVRLRDVLSSQQYDNARSPVTLALGKDIAGHPVIVDLAKMPHLLVAGTTGSGKSVGLNAMLLSMLFKTTPDQLRMILIDPKMLELSVYEGIPHLLTPVVTDMKDAANALRWCVAEMERRYRLMASLGVRNLTGYNQKIKEAEKSGMPLLDPLWNASMGEAPQPLTELPYIMVLIDEFADMMMVVGKKVEELIARIAQKARAAGIHLILATQRPSVDVITGLIKANIPTRIAFQVSSRIDSRTILDQQGAEQLLGHGDMLYLAPGSGVPVRVHGAYVADEEVHKVVQDLKRRGEPDYRQDILDASGGPATGGEFSFDGADEEGGSGEQDPLYDQAVQIVIETRRASISNIQRRLKIGYNRAANIVEAMEAAGIVSPMESNGSREVLVPATNDN